jgi:hypothetical protein
MAYLIEGRDLETINYTTPKEQCRMRMPRRELLLVSTECSDLAQIPEVPFVLDNDESKPPPTEIISSMSNSFSERCHGFELQLIGVCRTCC